jgi:hypothetical protein
MSADLLFNVGIHALFLAKEVDCIVPACHDMQETSGDKKCQR